MLVLYDFIQRVVPGCNTLAFLSFTREWKKCTGMLCRDTSDQVAVWGRLVVSPGIITTE